MMLGMSTSAIGRIVLTTGSREFERRDLVEAEISALPRDTYVIHGGARGADRLVSETIHKYPGLTEIRIPWLGFEEKKGGWLRNKKMADILEVFRAQGFEAWCIAFHEDIKAPSPGTTGMVKLMNDVGVAVVHIDGRTGNGF